MHSDSIEGIYDTLKQCALISKSAGGIGLNVHCIRAKGSYIAGVSDKMLLQICIVLKQNSFSFVLLLVHTVVTHYSGPILISFSNILQTNGSSNGLLPMLRVYNNTARYVDQGGNKVKDLVISLKIRFQTFFMWLFIPV